MTPPTFSERLRTRARLWWERPRSSRALVHWLADLHRFRNRDDSEDAWHCCPFWQRSVVHKWNGREFAARHGAPLPELYWRGGRLARVPLDRLPAEVVLKPVRGSSRKGVRVVVDGRELLRDEPATREDLRRRLSPLRRRPSPHLAEAYVDSGNGSGQLPLELKCHTFSGSVAAVSVVERSTGGPAVHRWYTPGWEPFPDSMNTIIPDADPREPPACLAELLTHASRLGTALGTYMRIDFFLSGDSCVFNEFSSVPASGLHFTPYCDEHFGALWAEHVPDET